MQRDLLKLCLPILSSAAVMLSAMLLLCRPSAAEPGTRFAAAGPSERSFKLQTITVESDENHPPCIFRDVQGNLQGIVIDERDLCEKRTGIKVDFRGMDWGTAQRFKGGRNADVIVGEGQLKYRWQKNAHE